MINGRVRKLIFTILIAGMVFIGDLQNTSKLNIASAQETGQVTLISDGPCGGMLCIQLSVSCNGHSDRIVNIRYQPVPSSLGSVIFTSGGYSSEFYADSSLYSSKTVQTMAISGFETYELAWAGAYGLGTGISGTGFSNAFCGYKEIIDFLSTYKFNNPDTVCATGNSAGGMQIAYGLTNYDLDTVLDLAVISGGPPTGRLDVACFGSSDPYYSAGIWPMGTFGRIYTDYIYGWERLGDYCKNAIQTPENTIALQDASIVSPTRARDLDYPFTEMFFVNSIHDSTNNQEQGRFYFDAILSEKSWLTIPGTIHEVHNTQEGSHLITDLLLGECKRTAIPLISYRLAPFNFPLQFQ